MPEDTIRKELLQHMSEAEVNELEERLKEIAAEHKKDDRNPKTWMDDLGDCL